MDESVQLQQVQARKLGIAKAGGGERRVEQDDWRIRGAGDPLPPAHGPSRAARKADPVAHLSCIERGIRHMGRHNEFGYAERSLKATELDQASRRSRPYPTASAPRLPQAFVPVQRRNHRVEHKGKWEAN